MLRAGAPTDARSPDSHRAGVRLLPAGTIGLPFSAQLAAVLTPYCRLIFVGPLRGGTFMGEQKTDIRPATEAAFNDWPVRPTQLVAP
jgi:hypothetical protein